MHRGRRGRRHGGRRRSEGRSDDIGTPWTQRILCFVLHNFEILLKVDFMQDWVQ